MHLSSTIRPFIKEQLNIRDPVEIQLSHRLFHENYESENNENKDDEESESYENENNENEDKENEYDELENETIRKAINSTSRKNGRYSRRGNVSSSLRGLTFPRRHFHECQSKKFFKFCPN
ncbi:43561_t:CDS:2 [Gigaspora margarita]|uniref:43561_t:CDS:1 n=1 Tax=Gigaspora margarita TaxID=4874 RepID=A0ABN7UCT6_GIGMA|nr:43561_t:CDS:2 [Gigaspora margarita]